MINDAGYEGQENRVGENITRRKNFKAANLLHLKYVDDMTLAESVDLRKKLIPVLGPYQIPTIQGLGMPSLKKTLLFSSSYRRQENMQRKRECK